MSTNGTAVKASLQDFDESTGKVSIQLPDGSDQRQDLSSFSEPDQQTIQEWYSLYKLFKNNRLYIRCNYTNDGYSFYLINRSETPLQAVQIKYRIYYTEDITRRPQTLHPTPSPCHEPRDPNKQRTIDLSRTRSPRKDIITIEKSITGELSVEILPATKSTKIETKRVPSISPDEIEMFGKHGVKRTIQKIDYVVYLPLPSGGSISKKFSETE